MRRMRRGRRPPPLPPRIIFHVANAEAVRGYDPAAPGRSEGQGAPAAQPSYELNGAVVSPPLVQAPYELDGTPIDPSSQDGSTCVKGCNKKCPRGKCVKATRRTVSFKDDGSTQAENSESETQTNEDSSKTPSEAKKANNNESSNANSTEDESESQSDEPSTSEAEASSVNEDPDWSISQDCLLRGMKEGNSSLPWEKIATALGKKKPEVIARWNLIKNLPTKKDAEISSPDDITNSDDDTSGDADDESETDTDQESEEDEEEDEEEFEEEVGIEEQDSDDDQDEESEEDSYVDDDESDDDDEEEEEYEANTKGKSPSRNKWHTGVRNEKVAAENKKAKANAKVKAAQQDDHSSSGEDASSESSDVESSSSDSQVIINDSHERAKMRHLHKLLYPPEIHPQPDKDFCKKDCELLGSIDAKYKKSRWLEMQANFYNVTGRLIPLETIRAKCERAEAEEAEKEARRAKKAAEREKQDRQKVNEWIQDVPEKNESGGSGS
ncbi:uncharacterized protein NECHADRAFT_84575 [Fusarium vanettenii 77-13-4]|uniref:Myb-like domain-containing protein n=1 Tax=Fusarium vanettenii (strain ATCC MYA-4622 / CBS 123669 / FGSC 9596 / NRRL 45880 / 77-13-4) TaxID=660122 RepID=C7YTG6_FUSV7|nr:uncharacterized protein NECHADRAFT_84575 [Fusarium vanettenii 77-13-4]EEU44616.1 predicted protein [Fusarium vanettenii 77-13-4]